MTYEKPILGEYKVEEPDITNVHQVTGAELGPFLKIHPDAPLLVRLDQWLVPVRDAFYDNEFGATILEIDLTVDSEPRQPYFCPTSGQMEDPRSGGFDVCCDRPDLHRPTERSP